jgi:DNA-binding winged helix-turn-helix (wHTH) protein/predicted ATPase
MIYALGPFRLDTQDNLLCRGSEPLALGRRALALLRALVERRGALVSKDALIEAAWPGQAVEESNLTVQIAALRKVLGEVPGADRWIETMPRRGYRFTAPVVAEEANAIAPPPTDARRDPGGDPAPSLHADPERRQIVAMSCELTGTSGRADGSGLEDLRDAIVAFRRCVAEMAGRHGGFLVRHLGNAELVLFGYPVAQEHDAEQAARAGLALCAAVGAARHGAGAPLQCRVGITTGMAIIGNLPSGGASEHREIVSDAPNLAMRLRLLAQPGMVAIDPATRRLIGGLFDCRDLGTIDSPSDAAGDTEPLRAWRVLGEAVTVNRFEALRGPSLTRLVGREEETDLLLRLWARAVAGEGQIALVSGEAGLGKSRLTVALEERLTTEPHFRLRYFCSPHHQDSPLFPFIDQLGRAAGFVREDTPASQLEKIRALAGRADLPDEDMAFLLDLLMLPMPEGQSLPELAPTRKKQRIMEALSRYHEGFARQQPVVVIFEDAHWIDATSRELLDIVVERARDLKMLLIVTFRPEFQPPWTGQPRVTILALNRLYRRDRISLIAQVADKALPEAVIGQIADRTDGVPLFIEELTKSVLESGLLRAEADRYVIDGMLPLLDIPTSLYGSLLARLDRQRFARLAAQIGSAIGREFTYELLRAVWVHAEEELQTALAWLVTSELVYQRGAQLDAVYGFKHALVRDAAYGSLLRDARRETHVRIAQALDAGSPGLMESQPELVARHYAEAGFIEKSVIAWARAAQASAARSALAESAAQYQKALDELARLPESSERLRQELEFRAALGALLRFVKGQAAPETCEAYARTSKLWEQLGSPPEFRQIPYGLSMVHVYRGELDQARRVGEGLLRLSRQRNDPAGMILGHSAAGQSILLAGGFAVSRSHLEDLLTIDDPGAERTPVQRTGSHPLLTQGVLAIGLQCLGFPDQGAKRSEAAIADARRLVQPTYLAVGLALGSLHSALARDQPGLTERSDALMAVASEQGLPFYQAWAAMFRGHAKVRQGDVAEGMALLRGGEAAYRRTGAVMWLPCFIALLAEAHEMSGQTLEAACLLDDAARLAERTGERWYAAELYRQKGGLMLRQGHSEAVERLYSKALSIAQEQGAKLWELRAATSLARLHREQGRRAEACDVLAPICGWFTEGFNTAELHEAKALLAELT